MTVIDTFRDDLLDAGKADATVGIYERYAQDFLRWAAEGGLGQPADLPAGAGHDYLAYLRTVRNLKPSSIFTAERALRAFGTWGTQNGALPRPLLPVATAGKDAGEPEPEWMVSFRRWCDVRGLSPRTIANYASSVEQYRRWFVVSHGKSFTPAELTLVDAGQFKTVLVGRDQGGSKAPKRKPATVNRAVAALRTFSKWADEAGITGYDTLAGLKRTRRSPSQGPRWLERTEQNRLVREIQLIRGEHRRVLATSLVRLMMQAGLRVQEVTNLRLEHVILEPANAASLLVEASKRDRSRTVELGGDVRRALEAWFAVRRGQSPYVFSSSRSEKMTTRAIQHIVSNLAKRARLEGRLNCHALRHSCGHELYLKGWDLGTIASYLGHMTEDGRPNIQMSVIYTHPGSADRRRAARSLDWDADCE